MKKSAILVFLASLGLGVLLMGGPVAADPATPDALPAVVDTDGRAGACYSFYHEGTERPYVQMAYDAGSRWDRFDFNWPDIEPSPGSWNFGPHEQLVDDLSAAGIDMVGILLWTPDWAATNGTSGLDGLSLDQRPFGWYAPEPHSASVDGPDRAATAVSAASSPPQGLYLAWDDPGNHWGNYVYTVVSHFAPRGITHWEMWNEPEWDYFWTGESPDYTQLLKVGYQATKAACPNCQVLFGGLHYWAEPNYYRWVLSQLNADPTAAANNYYFDIMSVHLYSRSANAYDVVNDIQDGMETFNVGDHPIWLTETGVPIYGEDGKPKYPYAATEDEAADYLIQSYANAWASGVERYFFFRTHDADMFEYFGMIRNNRSKRMAYHAYQVAATYLISPTFITRTPAWPVMRITLWDTPHGRVDVLWNQTPSQVLYSQTAFMSSATVVDRQGGTNTITPSGGSYNVTLQGATANLDGTSDYFIGGDPVLLIESETLDQPPTSSVDALPATIYTTTFDVARSGSDSESGIWAYDVQVRDGAGGEWQDWLQFAESTSDPFTGEHGHTYYFRCRAIDGVGNREDWPAGSQAQTTIDMSRTLHFSVSSFFADDDRDDVFDSPGEVVLSDVTLRLMDASGQDVIPPTTSGSFDATIYAEQTYYVWAIADDYMRALPFTGSWTEMSYTETYSELALWPVTYHYLPIVAR